MGKLFKTYMRNATRAVLKSWGLAVHRTVPYQQDGLCSIHNSQFMKDPVFRGAYARGVKASGIDYQWDWRVHTGLWAASHALKLSGAFVECGVNRGFLSSAIMQYLNWNHLNRNFYLFDTFRGLVDAQVNPEERAIGRLTSRYSECYEEACRNFSEFHNVYLIRGTVPDTLSSVSIDQVAYLSIDMNCAMPEVAAVRFFWPKLIQGGVVLFDDYAYQGYEPQAKALDELALELGVSILALPTGQGLLLKP
jgi:hypothetical protein